MGERTGTERERGPQIPKCMPHGGGVAGGGKETTGVKVNHEIEWNARLRDRTAVSPPYHPHGLTKGTHHDYPPKLRDEVWRCESVKYVQLGKRVWRGLAGRGGAHAPAYKTRTPKTTSTSVMRPWHALPPPPPAHIAHPSQWHSLLV